MQQFTPRPDSFREIRNKIVIMMLIIFGGIVFIVLVVPSFISDTSTSGQPTTWPYLLILLSGAMGYSLVITLKRQKKKFESYALKITDDALVREANHLPTITLPKKEIREITKNANGTFTIVGASRLNAIGVPAQIENPEVLERLLNEIKPVQVRTSRAWLERLFIPLSFSGVALMMITFLASNKIIVLTSGLACVVFMTYSMIVTQRSKNVDTKTKRGSLIVILPLLAVIAAMIMKLTS